MSEPSPSWQLDTIAYEGGSKNGPRASVQLSRRGEQARGEGSGSGPVDALCQAISKATGVAARVVAFRAYSIGPGSEAVGQVELEVEMPGRRAVVAASSTDLVEAAGQAFLAAINQHGLKS